MRFWHACAPATAHELPTSENWDQTSLGEVIGRALKPFDERFLIQGPELRGAREGVLDAHDVHA
jgi:hypothetical protein